MIQIVFDMDGVIFDTEALCQKAWRTVGEERGISIAEIDELLKLCIGSNQQHMTEVLREKLGEDFPVPCFLSEAAEQIQLLANEHLPLKKGAEELLKWLKEQKAAVGLASSTASPIVKKYLEKAGLTEYFQIIIGGIRSYTASRMEKSIRRRVLRLGQIRYRRMAWRILITESVPLPMPA